MAITLSPPDALLRLEAALAEAVEGWMRTRSEAGRETADMRVDAARRALTTYTEGMARVRVAQNPPREVMIVRVPRGTPRLRQSRRLMSHKPTEQEQER